MKHFKQFKHFLCLIFALVSLVHAHTEQCGQEFSSIATDKKLFNTNCDVRIKVRSEHSLKKDKKSCTFLVFVAGDNNLGPFLIKNIQQMAMIGSTEHINIVVHVDMRAIGNKKISRRYYVEKNKLTQIDNIPTQYMDSGNPETLISFCRWAIEDYPADDYVLVLSNHGTGPIDPQAGKVINPSELFFFNPRTNKYDLDRSVGFLDLIAALEPNQRGICWDDTTGNYLTNQKLDSALNTICTECLGGNKFSIIGFDACLMATLEIANIIKKYADIMISSQEVELGAGWRYNYVLSPFQDGPVEKRLFAEHIVNDYDAAYAKITNDYTLSAMDLTTIDNLEANVDHVATLLIECMQKQTNNSVKSTIQRCSSQQQCTHFDEPSYKDLDHFYRNLLDNLSKFTLSPQKRTQELLPQLKAALEQGRLLIQESVFANVVGKNLRNARGVTIYLPKLRIHPSYRKTTFAENNNWIYLLTMLTQ